MEILVAPVQGHTDAAFRHFHAEQYGGDLTYYTPFIRLENFQLRAKEIKDLTSVLNSNHKFVPQIIFKDTNELQRLIELLKEMGFKEIDLNMGCPFPLQMSHGRGAATISNHQLAESMVEVVNSDSDITFSLKMRLGQNDPEEWKGLMPYLNRMNLKHIVLHPRIGRQQYSGEPDMEQFGAFLKVSKNPVIYNGDLKHPDDIEDIRNKFPEIAGVMLGRGLLGRPSLAEECINGELSKEERVSRMLDFHRKLFQHYSTVLCGDSQIISKIKPFWEYAEEDIGRKPWKAIKKAVNMAKYQSAVASINSRL